MSTTSTAEGPSIELTISKLATTLGRLNDLKAQVEKMAADKAAGGPDWAPSSTYVFRHFDLFLAMEEMKKDAKLLVDAINDVMPPVEAACMDNLIREGIDKITVEGRTISIRTEYWASAQGDAPGEEPGTGKKLMIQVLKDNPKTSWLVEETVNAMRLSAFARDNDRDNIGNPVLPPELAAVIKVTAKVSLRSVKA